MNLLLIGDSLRLTTGFAQVLREVAREAVRTGWRVGQIASLDLPPFIDSGPFHELGVDPFYPQPGVPTGWDVADQVFRRFQPDVVLINADPGTVNSWMHIIKSFDQSTPLVVYAPVEGAPISPVYAESFRMADRAVTYTQWSARALKAEHKIEASWAYHGVDTSVFKPIDEGKRRSWRRKLGWEGRFVVTYVARNRDRKQHPRLLQAAAHLQGNGQDDDLLLYLHCQPYDGHWSGGWNLQHVAAWCEVTDRVQFQADADPVRGEDQISIATKLACSDLYVHVAQVEGFGLPILEAMACQTPVMIPHDNGNMMEVVGAGVNSEGQFHTGAAAAIIQSSDVETWFNGAQLYNLDPYNIASAIYQWRHSLTTAQQKLTGQRAYEWATSGRFNWQEMAAHLLGACEEAATARITEELLPAD